MKFSKVLIKLENGQEAEEMLRVSEIIFMCPEIESRFRGRSESCKCSIQKATNFEVIFMNLF